jgi:myosin heavy subunit
MSSAGRITVGEKVWAWSTKAESFMEATVEKLEAHKNVVIVKQGGSSLELKEDLVHKKNAAGQDGAGDNTLLRELNEATLLHNVRHRYNSKDDGGCYSFTGHILIAVNPFRSLKVYSEADMKRYLSQAIGKEPPHIFAIADRMYRLLVSQGESQAIIVSGPSGSGKTETCKLVLRHLAYVTRNSVSNESAKSSLELGKLLVLTNPLLEAFGNAETVLNRNSSRFGKFTQIHVSRDDRGQGAILGASIQTYLLESTRVVLQSANECNYHIFYQMILGMSGADKQAYTLHGDPNKYAFLRSATGKATERRGMDGQGFTETSDVLTAIKVGKNFQVALFQTLSGLLLLGNLELYENPNGDVQLKMNEDLSNVVKLLGANKALLQQALCSRTMKLKGSEMQIPLKPEEARNSRDALAKAIYLKLFGWVVQQINYALIDQNLKSSNHNFLGILDIYGFENFEKNSLEQLFINFTNEQLHQHFAVSLFKTEQEIYMAEGIIWPGVEWEDNSDCIEMIAGKSPSSIFNMLTEHSRLPKASDPEMTEKLLADHRKSKYMFPPKMGQSTGRSKAANRLTHREAFTVKHFAGDVMYRTEGWLKKNTDTLHEDLSLCMSSSSSIILAQLFSVGTINAITGGARGGSKRAGFVADKYVRQLDELMRTLKATHSHFVRCIKPNHEQKPHMFKDQLVLDQLNNSGMVDAVRLLAAGYPTRVPFELLERQFKPLAPRKFQDLPPHIFSAALLRSFDLNTSDFLLGLSKAFFKAGKLAFVDSLMSRTDLLNEKFWAKFGRLLTLWRFRRGIAAVKCLIFLNAKMRRLRALWKFRRSATIASLVGRSWVRRANEIRYGRAIEVLQAYGRGFSARHLRAKKAKGVQVMQRMGRGYLARQYRERVRVEREVERKVRAKAERERKIREKKEAAEALEKKAKADREAADADRRTRMKNASNKFGGGASIPEDGGAPDKNLGADEYEYAADAAADDDNDAASDGSDLIDDSDEDDEFKPRGSQADLQNPKDLLAATAALDMKEARKSLKGGEPNIPKLGLSGVSSEDDGPLSVGGRSGVRQTPSRLSRMKMDMLGGLTPRSARGTSGFFSSRRGGVDGKKLFLSKTAKGSMIAANTLRVSKREALSGNSGWQERFLLLVGDVIFIFNLAGQPEMPLGFRLWPNQVVRLSESKLAMHNAPLPSVSEPIFKIPAIDTELGILGIQAEDKETADKLALAMHMGVTNVRRARQQARLDLAQQVCHEMELSLMKTRHMIELLHKSQEMFFEAGSGQFDDCNAVCMHSGVMRQSLIDVTPFMPVSDFICEYCSCVIIPEENAQARRDAAEARVEEHEKQIKKEAQRKLQVDKETLLVMDDVRGLRARRKVAEEEATKHWETVEQSVIGRQDKEQGSASLQLKQELSSISSSDLDALKSSLLEQIAAIDAKRTSLKEHIEHKFNKKPEGDEKGRPLQKKFSFSRQKKGGGNDAAPDAERAAPSPKPPVEQPVQKKDSFSRKMTRVLSFGKKGKKDKDVDADGEAPKKKESTASSMVRKLSFGKKKE